MWELLDDEEAATLDDDESLFARRAIDSIGLLRFVGFVESPQTAPETGGRPGAIGSDGTGGFTPWADHQGEH